MTRFRQLTIMGATVALLFWGACSAGDDGANAGTRSFKPGLAVHYYRDAMYWNGNWASDFLPKVPPDKWVLHTYCFTRIEDLVNHSFINRSWFSLRMSGYVEIPKPDYAADNEEVTFFLIVDHGARLKVNGKVVVDAWMLKRGAGREVSGTIRLKPGRHVIEIEGYFGANSRLKDGMMLKLLWQSDGYGLKKSVVPTNALSHDDLQLVPEPGRKKTVSTSSVK